MDLAFDLDTAAQARADSGLPGRHPSWPELVARMVAARQASGSLGQALRDAAQAEGGSFHERTAQTLVAHAARRGSVNPNDLGNRKLGEATSSPVAGHASLGGRGKP